MNGQMDNKQIEEMAKILCENYNDGRCLVDGFNCMEGTCERRERIEKLISAGYRKERQGEWKKVNEKYPRYVCTACNHLYNNKEYKYCPNCGSKMKGE